MPHSVIRSQFYDAFSMPESPSFSPQTAIYDLQRQKIKSIIGSFKDDSQARYLLECMQERIGHHFSHTLRVGVEYCCLVDNDTPSAPLPNSQTDHFAGTLHDVGKLKVPGRILFKKGNFTPEELKIMKSHNQATEKLLTPMNDRYLWLSVIASYHHPYNHNPEDTPDHIKRRGLLLRLADNYDGMRSRRDYKSPLGEKSARKELINLFPREEEHIEFLLVNFPGKT